MRCRKVMALENSKLMSTNLPEYAMFLKAQIRAVTEAKYTAEHQEERRNILLLSCKYIGSQAQLTQGARIDLVVGSILSYQIMFRDGKKGPLQNEDEQLAFTYK